VCQAREPQGLHAAELRPAGVLLMPSETGKSMARRLRDPLFYLHVFSGQAIDIGAGPDGLSKYAYLFPKLTSVRDWDLPDGDANVMEGLEAESFDCVHASHCLEHMVALDRALGRWWELVKPGGFLVFTVPDEAMYEQGVWPSTWNPDHKWSFRTDFHTGRELPKSRGVQELVGLLEWAQLIKLERLVATWKPNMNPHSQPNYRIDQTGGPLVESAIEVVLRKAIPAEGAPWS
jgi:SAM-dependent methyltransferase